MDGQFHSHRFAVTSLSLRLSAASAWRVSATAATPAAAISDTALTRPMSTRILRCMASRLSDQAFVVKQPLWPEPLRAVYTQDRPIDFRPVSPVDPFQPERRAPAKHVWFRADGGVPDDTLSHQATLAYASDYGLLGTALLPHGLSFQMRRLQAATLDHALWLHRPFRADEWLLYSTDAPSASGARGESG